MGRITGGPAISAGILDRNMHRVEIIHLNENSYRMKHRETIFEQKSVPN